MKYRVPELRVKNHTSCTRIAYIGFYLCDNFGTLFHKPAHEELAEKRA